MNDRESIARDVYLSQVDEMFGRSRVMAVEPLSSQYAREELIWQIREQVLEFKVIKVGNGPFDLEPKITDPCVVCGEHLIDRVDDKGNVSALGLGVYAKSKWIVFHTRCVRVIEQS